MKRQETQEEELHARQSEETHFRIASSGGDGVGRGVLRFLAPGLPVFGNRRLADLACVIHG